MRPVFSEVAAGVGVCTGLFRVGGGGKIGEAGIGFREGGHKPLTGRWDG